MVRQALIALLLLLTPAALSLCPGRAQDSGPMGTAADSPPREPRKLLSPEERKSLVKAFARGDRELDGEIIHALAPDGELVYADRDETIDSLERNYSDLYYYGPRAFAINFAVGEDTSWIDRYSPPRPPKRVSATDLEIIQILIDSGFDVNAMSGYRSSATTPLHTAASHGDVELIKVLIAGGANVNSNVFGSPLSRAAMYNHTEAAKVLITAGADFNIIGNFGNNPLNEAARGNHMEVAEFLLEAGIDVDLTSGSYGFFTPLHDARSPEFAKLLLDAGANPDAENKYKQTPLTLAASFGMIDIVKLMIAAGANVNHTSGYGYTPLNQAAERGEVEVATALIEAGADVNLTGASYGFFTPLHNAAEYGHLDMVRVLVAAGAQLNATNKFGATPLSLASAAAHLDVAKALVQAGAAPTNQGQD